jgi:succinyl-diaminopimelate desuccinylase
MDDVARTLLAWIDADRDRLVGFLSRFIAAPSPNPPGDTRAAAALLRDYLAEQGAPVRVLAAKPELPNVVASFAGARGGPHLVLNGHIDVFPVGADERWTHGAWSGVVAEEKIWGRGAVDMKCGTAASVLAFVYLHRLRDRLAGRLTLTAVSDEETGGTWGSRWLVEEFGEEFRGDCCLNGEPGTPETIRFGEKGTLRLVFEVSTPGAHAAYTHLSANAIRIAGDVIRALYELESFAFEQPRALREAVERSAPVMDRVLGAGAGAILNRVTVSVGVIQGGLKINMLPGRCRFEVDLRLPIGLAHAPLLAAIDARLAGFPQCRMEVVRTHSSEPTWCAPDHAMVDILKRSALALRGVEPVPTVSLGASDTKFWRRRGIPAYIYGCSPINMARADEYVSVAEFLDIIRVHTLAAAAYLRAG